MPRRPASGARSEDLEGTPQKVSEDLEAAEQDVEAGKPGSEGKNERKDKKDKKDKKEKHKSKEKKDKKEKPKKHANLGSENKKRKLLTAQENDDEIDKLLSFDWLHQVSKDPAKAAAPEVVSRLVDPWESRLPSDAPHEVFDPVMELRRKIEKLLVNSGGEITLGKAEEHLQTTLGSQVLGSFSLSPPPDGNPSNTVIRLTAKQACALLEEPSLQMAALEESYFALGEEVMQLGLDFENEEAFRHVFDDLLAKREEVRMAAERMGFTMPYVPRSRRARRSQRDLPPMTQDETNLLHDIRRIIKALSVHESWVPLSQLLEDNKIRRARWKLPGGLALWEWLLLRCGDQLTTVNERTDMLLQLADEGKTEHTQQMIEERRQELSLAVFETLSVLQRDFPQGGGLSLEDLQRIPAIACLNFSRTALMQALHKMKTLEVVRNRGQVMVRLHAAPSLDPPQRSQTDKHREKTAEPETPAGAETPQGALARGHRVKKPEIPITVSEWQKSQDKYFKGWEPLPEGWLRVISRSTNKVFFVNRNNGATQLELPQEPAPQTMPS